MTGIRQEQDKALVEELEHALQLESLNDKDQRFARSMIGAFHGEGAQGRYRGSLTAKQRYWITRLVRRALGQGELTERHLGELKRYPVIIELFDEAAETVTWPAARLRIDDCNVYLRRTGSNSVEPGSVALVSSLMAHSMYYGKVSRQEGALSLYLREARPTVPGIHKALKAFCDDPAKITGQLGRELGVCPLCDKPLESRREKEVGRDQRCSKAYGLPW